MIILTTERLEIVDLSLDDAQLYFDILNSPGWINNIGDRGIKTLIDAENYVRKNIALNNDDSGQCVYKMVLSNTGEEIGVCSLLKRPELRHYDIGFAIFSRFENNGYTTEGSQALLDYAMKELNIFPVIGITTKENIASQRVLQKIGLKKIGTTNLKDDPEILFLFSNE